MGKYHWMNEDEVPKCVAKSCHPLHLFWTCGRGMITFCIIARGWEDKSEVLKHCRYQDLPVPRSMVCSLEQVNKKLWNHAMLLVTTGWGEQRTVLSRAQTFLSTGVVDIEGALTQRVRDFISFFIFSTPAKLSGTHCSFHSHKRYKLRHLARPHFNTLLPDFRQRNICVGQDETG